MAPDPQTTFRALSDPTRRDILSILAKGDKTIGEVAQHFDITRPAIKKHLAILEDGHLIDVITRGRERINHLRKDGLMPVIDWLSVFDAFWDNRLTALKSTIEKDLHQ
jgi:DNA-binding transcriptional ArsR family regulator